MLKKSLYGIKQSPRQWYKKFDTLMLCQEFKSNFDSFVYFRHVSCKTSIYLLLYVDIMLIASQSHVEIQSLKLKLNSVFEMKELGEARKILGIEISRNRQLRKVLFSQKSYLKKLIRKFHMLETKEVNVPFVQHYKLSHIQLPSDEESMREMKKIPHSSVVGSLTYCMVCTRPDLAHAMSG